MENALDIQDGIECFQIEESGEMLWEKRCFSSITNYELEVDIRKAQEGGELQREGRVEGTAWQLGKEVDLGNLYHGSLARC